MNQDNPRKNATKHYQNSDYPTGSFEEAINADHQESLREGASLRLERHPLAPGNSGVDLEEMVPAFMHRDFFRSEEDPIGAVPPSSRLRSVPRNEPAPDSEASGYFEPPNTEEPLGLDPPTAELPAPPLRPRMAAAAHVAPPPVAAAPSVVTPPSEPLLRVPLKPEPLAPAPALAPVASATQEPLAPLRSDEAPPVAQAPRRPLRAAQPQADPVPPVFATPAPGAPAPAAAVTAAPTASSAYSWPLLVALALVMGIFVWREQSRPVVAVAEPLPIPTSIVTPVVVEEMAEPTPAGIGFRPTFVAVGPPVPALAEEAAVEATPGMAAEGDEAGLFPEESHEDDDEERAAILERMSHASQESQAAPSSPVAPASSGSGDLFPITEEDAPVRAAAPVREASRPKAPASKPAASKPAASKPAAPAPVPVAASAADLFPIDEELPLSQTKPKASAPAPAAATQAIAPAPPQQVAPVRPASPPPEGYQIAEPTF